MPPGKILVTGSTGFVGRWVTRLWDEVVAWPRSADLADKEQVEETALRLYEEEQFHGVLHLAAQASPRRSVEKPCRTWQVNLMGTVHLLEGLSRAGFQGAFLQVSSGAVYGKTTGEITEESETFPSSPYVASKLAAELAALEWGRRTGNRAMVVRPFNHSGPGQTDHYFLPAMARQITCLPAGGGVIEVGNLKVHRDFLHVREVVGAYRALLEGGRNGEIYNLASGRSHTLSDLLDKLAELSGRRVEYRVTLERFREEKEEAIRVDLSKLLDHTGWRPQMSLGQLLQDLLEDWMTKSCRKQHS